MRCTLVVVMMMALVAAGVVAGNEECKANCMQLNAHCPTIEGDLSPVVYAQGNARLPEDDCMNRVRTCMYSCNG